jgi:CheY-like chemotaxis protein
MLWERYEMPDAKIDLLIVDDQLTIRNSLSYIFTGLGHTVRSAEDGFSALIAIRQQVPDVLLCDLNMPGMSGFELLSVVRRRFPSIQAIAMSGAFSGEGLQLGVAADAFYEKGTGLSHLIQIVQGMSSRDFRPSLRSPSKLAPIWIHRNGHNPAGEAYVTITCPECMRTYPQVLDEALHLIHESACPFCSSLIHYAILQPTDPASPQAFQRKPVVLTMPIPIRVPNTQQRTAAELTLTAIHPIPLK